MTDSPHLTSEQVAAYLDDTLPEAECARVKAHLADCSACRKEIVSVSSLVEKAPRSRRRLVALSTMAVAAAVLVIVFARVPSNGLSERTAVRGSTTPAGEGAATVEPIAPVGSQTTRGEIVFVWHPASPRATYRVTLTDDRGGKLWTGSTNDTTLAMPKSTAVLAGQRYYWYVDVLQADGAPATSGITSFQVAQ